ncbi:MULTISPECIES: TOBE domain-containing protein [Gordonibacter]|uniref:Molybdopterin-binding protein n=1 Tax=Gordonibacter faecis TaxID=3047475 RepID=A0ABT7DM39_9ACTN|nr:MULTISPECIES: molybdopterin-binding protein [unclassified Gordonibacter]MDJ1649638.1 molybdopterin-binding protein [Gordonibacter sp. KGMB12511]HIW76586.1 molybdopterin-binding protein [Candidatus Gordonibacter avicola]
MKLSARNTLKGTITAIHPGAVNAIVIMELDGGQIITSTISMGALKDLALEVGKEAYAIVKAADVIIGVED